MRTELSYTALVGAVLWSLNFSLPLGDIVGRDGVCCDGTSLSAENAHVIQFVLNPAQFPPFLDGRLHFLLSDSEGPTTKHGRPLETLVFTWRGAQWVSSVHP